MKKTVCCLLLFLAALLPFSASASHTVMIASDLHYCAPSLYEGSDLFMRSIAQGDGKMVHKSDVLLDALVRQAEQLSRLGF